MFLADRLSPESYDCFVIGSGPAGVSLALALARAGRRVLLAPSLRNEHGGWTADYVRLRFLALRERSRRPSIMMCGPAVPEPAGHS